MVGSTKHVFWEALLITMVVFILGILLGIAYESKNLNKINDYYAVSEISLMDTLALNDIMQIDNVSCENLIQSNLDFADRIYYEARLLEKYEEAGKISDSLKLSHKKYDLMRTFLWANTIKISDKCENVNSIVYLYESETKDLSKKATQNVWAKILYDLKQEFGEKIVLIPIAADSNLTSLNALIREHNINSYPVVIINNEQIVKELSTVEDLKSYLK